MAILEDLAAETKSRRVPRATVPFTAETSPVAKAMRGQPAETPWATTHDNTTATRDDAPLADANIQVEQVPLRLSKAAQGLAADLRKGSMKPRDEYGLRAPAPVEKAHPNQYGGAGGAHATFPQASQAGVAAHVASARVRMGTGTDAEAGAAHRTAAAAYRSVQDPADQHTKENRAVMHERAAAQHEQNATVHKAEWSTAEMNGFPDSSFLHIEDGGSKDEEGKTTPRSLRHFPVRDAGGELDLPHLRNALSRIPQSSLPEKVRESCSAEARKLLDKVTEDATEKMWREDLSSGAKAMKLDVAALRKEDFGATPPSVGEVARRRSMEPALTERGKIMTGEYEAPPEG